MSFSIYLSKSCDILFVFSLIFSFFFLCSPAGAEPPVSGRYLSANGRQIVLGVDVSNRPPANFIVEQRLPPGNTIVGAKPLPQKIDQQRGTVKWLVRKANNGKNSFSIQLRSPLQGPVDSTVRYRNPTNGNFTELQIRP